MAYGQCDNAKLIEKWGNFDNWIVREIKESGIIGGNTRHLYEIAKGDSIKGEIPYVNPDGCVWSNSNVMAIVKGVTKTSCSVYPEKRDDGYCVRLETRLERIKVIGLINLNVIASGTIFLGKMLEPIRNTKNPQSKLDVGIPFTDKPKGITFDYKVVVGHARLKATGFGAPKELNDNDYADCVVMLQKRWEDEAGNVYSRRVGTAYHRFTPNRHYVEQRLFPSHSLRRYHKRTILRRFHGTYSVRTVELYDKFQRRIGSHQGNRVGEMQTILPPISS